MSATPKTLKDVMGNDLTGFQVVKAYFLELEHGLMGFVPAIIKKNKEMVVCLDKSLLEKVWNLLPRRKAKVVEAILLVKMDGSFGFDIRNENKEDTDPIHILSEKEFNGLTEGGGDSPFGWAPGLLGLKKDDRVPSPFE
jgi:hypothetical protein